MSDESQWRTREGRLLKRAIQRGDFDDDAGSAAAQLRVETDQHEPQENAKQSAMKHERVDREEAGAAQKKRPRVETHEQEDARDGGGTEQPLVLEVPQDDDEDAGVVAVSSDEVMMRELLERMRALPAGATKVSRCDCDAVARAMAAATGAHLMNTRAVLSRAGFLHRQFKSRAVKPWRHSTALLELVSDYHAIRVVNGGKQKQKKKAVASIHRAEVQEPAGQPCPLPATKPPKPDRTRRDKRAPVVESAQDAALVRAVLKIEPPMTMQTWGDVAVAFQGKHSKITNAWSARRRIQWLVKVHKDPRHMQHEQRSPTLRQLLDKYVAATAMTQPRASVRLARPVSDATSRTGDGGGDETQKPPPPCQLIQGETTCSGLCGALQAAKDALAHERQTTRAVLQAVEKASERHHEQLVAMMDLVARAIRP